MSSRSRRAAEEAEELVLVGRVRRAHGVHGELLIEVLSDVERRFAPGSRLLLAAGAAPPRLVTVTAARPHRDALLLRLEEVVDRDAASELRGAEIMVPRGAVPEPPADGYYYFQLVGCRIRDADRGELGEVVEVAEDGGGVLLEVEGERGRWLLPFVAEHVLRVDVSSGTIEVRLPVGIVEACGSE